MHEPKPLIFSVTYLAPDGSPVTAETLEAFDHWDACGFAWRKMPKGAVDFQIEETPSIP
tara:strand:- start:745 stop:921 length:177 start_codon:yes stop_codon:yes gene_type:complete